MDLNKTISKLPSDPAEKIKLVKAAIEAALKEYTATNSTTADNIKELAESVKTASNVNGVTIAWKVPDDFVIQTPTDSVNGKVTGTLNLSCDSESDTVLVNCPIERSDEQKLADANAKALAALLAMIATNNTTADDVIAVINNALSNTGVTAAWKTDNGFAKTLATKDASGLITGMIELTLNHKTSDVTVNLTIVCLAGDKKALADTITEANNANTVTVNLPKTVQEKVISSHVVNTIVVIDRPDIAINMNLESITEINKQAKVDTNSYKTESFTDVKIDAYYAPYVNWAVSNGITNGTTSTTFSPDQIVTRQEMAVFMSNYTNVLGYKIPEICAPITFDDNNNIGSWAATAVKQMQMAGVLSGKDSNRFDPTGKATRAEVSATLHRYVELVIDSANAQDIDMNDNDKIV